MRSPCRSWIFLNAGRSGAPPMTVSGKELPARSLSIHQPASTANPAWSVTSARFLQSGKTAPLIGTVALSAGHVCTPVPGKPTRDFSAPSRFAQKRFPLCSASQIVPGPNDSAAFSKTESWMGGFHSDRTSLPPRMPCLSRPVRGYLTALLSPWMSWPHQDHLFIP